MEIEPIVTISLERYNELLRLESNVRGYGIDHIFMTLNSFGWCKADIKIFGRDEAILKLKDECERYQKEQRELVEGLRDCLRQTKSIKHSILSKIPTSWLFIKD